jgi:hypothetical protein
MMPAAYLRICSWEIILCRYGSINSRFCGIRKPPERFETQGSLSMTVQASIREKGSDTRQRVVSDRATAHPCRDAIPIICVSALNV